MGDNFEEQNSVFHPMHSIPRFGHTSRLASLASYDDYERSQYVNGIIAFLVFLGMFALVWAVVLLMLKYSLGSSRVGCAAGGKPVDVSEMRRAGIRKSARKAQIRRNWRVQVAFLACCLSIPALSFVFVNHGLHPFFSSLEEVGTISGQVGREAVEGVQIATRLVSIREGMDALVSSLDVDEYCPNVDFDDADGDANIAVLASVWDGVRHNMDTVRDFVDRHAREFAVGLSRVSEVAYYVGQKVDEAETYDWKVKCMLIILNVVNALMLLGVLLTRNGINNSPYQTILTFFVVPSFVVMTALTIAFTGVAASMAVVNADFCSGGVEEPGSPMGTLFDILAEQGYNETDMPYKAVEYYTSDCDGPSPIDFLYKFGDRVNEKDRQILELLDFFGKFDPEMLDAACGRSIQPLNESLYQLSVKLRELEDVIAMGNNLTACDNIEPIARSLLDGATCSVGPKGAAALFGTSFAMALMGLIMLSTRAALYNPVLKPRRVKRREREFREYREYMGKFYDTSKWSMDADPAKEKNIAPAATFDTEDDTGSSASGSPRSAHSLPSPVSPRRETSVFVGSPLPSSAAKSASSPFPGSRMVAAAAAKMSGFYDSDPEVEYYSSDSDDDDDDSTDAGRDDENTNSLIGPPSIMSGLSNITDLVHRVFLTRSINEHRRVSRDDESSISSRRSSSLPPSPTSSTGTGPQWRGDLQNGSVSTGGGPVPPPAAFIPEHKYRCNDPAFDCDIEQQEMEHLTPVQHKAIRSAADMILKEADHRQKQQPETPKKEVKSRGRTSGASKMEKY